METRANDPKTMSDAPEIAAGSGMSPGIIRAALDLIASEAGFLVEAKLVRLLEPLPSNQRLMMKLDSIFKALAIKTESDIGFLAKYCLLDESSDGGVSQLIHPNTVPEALRTFVEDFLQAKGLNNHQAEQANLNGGESRGLEYWQNISVAHVEEHDRIWSALSTAQEKYGEVLLERSRALDRTDELEQENGELKQLLQHYMTSEVNNELVIPPTAVLAQQVRQGARGAATNSVNGENPKHAV